MRGELKKSDVVATSLATQSLQQLIIEPCIQWFFRTVGGMGELWESPR